MRLWLVSVVCAGLCAGASPEIAGCPVLTTTNIWNTAVDELSVTPVSAKHIATAGAGKPLHPDFGVNPGNGIPVNIVSHTRGVTRITYKFEYADESDKVIYPMPANPVFEGGQSPAGDGHLIVVDKDTCMLYEIFDFKQPAAPGKYAAGSGAVYNLRSDLLRPDSWTSGDAAGMPILPGLVRYEEVAAGEINHALRFTLPQIQKAYIWPARHSVNKLAGAEYMPMGSRLRLKASVDITRFSPTNQVILKALKKYGMMLSDIGSAWFISGSPDPHWNDDDLHQLTTITGNDFEEVDVSDLMAAPDTGETLISVPRAK
jgi:hypothetical protein